MNDCCTTGIYWPGQPIGRETTFFSRPAYVTGTNTSRAILICHDALGWKWNNARLLADHFAKEVGATVYLPDFFDGNTVGIKDVIIEIEDGKAKMAFPNPKFDVAAWYRENDPNLRLPIILEVARGLREKYDKLGVVGYCWGGSVAFKLASSKYSGLIDCVTIAHPGQPPEEDVKLLKVPVQILAPEVDPTFTTEWRSFCNVEIPKIEGGLDYCFRFFPDQQHGFTTKGDLNIPTERRAVEMAKRDVVFWQSSFLEWN